MSSRKPRNAERYLSKREQQIMELLHRRQQLTAAELTETLPGDASNSTVRTLLRILEEKGRVRHTEKDGRFLYAPAESNADAARPALLSIARTFFRGSIGDVVMTLISTEGKKLSEEEWDRLQRAIDRAREGSG